MKKKLQQILATTLQNSIEKGQLKEAPIPDYVIEVPKNAKHGHFATNLPMALRASQGKNPREIASVLKAQLQDVQGVFERVDIAGPGFINFVLKSEQWCGELRNIVTLGDDYGRSQLGKGSRVVVEFVSANPTGPLHIGHGRGAALGDTLCRIFSFCGYEVASEFYINDAGRQIRLLGESIFSRWKQVEDPGYPFPDEGYKGDYVFELARSVSEEIDLSKLEEKDAISTCARLGKEMMLKELKQDMELFRVPFDVWFSEESLFTSGKIEKTLDELRKNGHLYTKDGALWIKTLPHGDDKDRVLRKSDGEFTYFASDISYHIDKKERGFSKAINLWGADHHGYIPRMKAGLEASNISGEWLSVMLIQLVKLWKGGQEIKMSKRSGSYVTLKELVEEVGIDAARFVFLSKHHASALDFDIDLVKKQDSDNPVYYVQYAHARICSIFRKAEEEGIDWSGQPDPSLTGLVLDEEISLIRMMAEFPILVEDVCESLEPHRLTYYLTNLAALFHRYFNLGTKFPEHRIVAEDRALSEARLFLALGVKQIIATGLGLLGIHAPRKM